METRESLPPPPEPREIRNTLTQIFRVCVVCTATTASVKKKVVSGVVSRPRETVGMEKGEGSLSSFILPIETREISPMKAGD